MPIPITREAEQSIEFHPLLKEGTYKVEYYPSKDVTTEQKQILQKFSKIIQTNAKTQSYLRQMEEGRKPAYNSSIGISRPEYNHLIELFSNQKPLKVDGTLTISKGKNRLFFNGDGRLSILDSVSVFTNSTSASFKKYNLSRSKDSVDLSNSDIFKGNTLENFELYTGPDGILGLTGLEGEYELLIGTLEPSGRTYLSFFAKQPDNVEHPIADYITVIFN